MPIYEFKCEDCGKKYEHLVFKQDEKVCCPACSSENSCRLMSACGFQSKGGGGETVKSAAGASDCGGCTAGSCAGCH